MKDKNHNTPKKSKIEMHSIAEHNQSVDSPSKKVHPISSLTPYQNRWTIKARVSSKGALRTYSNSRGSGQLFNFVLIDESGEIRVTAYNEDCERIFNTIEAGKVYQVSQCQIKPANRQYSSVNNDYEMSVQGDSQFILCPDDTHIPKVDFNFTKIEAIGQRLTGTLVDVIGVLLNCGDLTSITTKQGKELKKKELKIGDETGYAVIF